VSKTAKNFHITFIAINVCRGRVIKFDVFGLQMDALQEWHVQIGN